jgi:EAL domain-containing protein (putative c-di-GMP-specific phosphodiesterase class I)
MTTEHDAIGEQELAAAIAVGEMVVHYQPKIDLNAEAAWQNVGAEALVRWAHPRRGLIGPSDFIGLAERTGLILPLTMFVLETAIAQVRVWQDDGAPVSMAVNLAAQLLTDLRMPDQISAMLEKHGVPPSSLILEVTESAAMADTLRAMDILTRFRLKGMGLSMDDFGTGYSSLLQLHRMPFSELKIDRSFVTQLGEAQEALIMVRSMIHLAHDLGLSVCAEGVETGVALKILRSLRCDKAQGYYIGRPAPADQLTRMLKVPSHIDRPTVSQGARGLVA